MADNAAKFVLSALVDTWSRGTRIFPFFTDLGPVVRLGDSVDVPNDGTATVNTTEAGSVETVALSANTLTVNRTKFINRAIGNLQAKQLLNGQFSPQLLRSMTGQLWNALERDVIEYLFSVAALDANNHVNLAADAVTDDDAAELEQKINEQDGYTDSSMFRVLASPSAVKGLRGIAEYFGGLAPTPAGDFGSVAPRSLNGVELIPHNAVPGNVNALSTTTSVVNVSSLVATATVADSSLFTPGQLITTAGLTENDVATPILTVPDSTTITYTTAASDATPMADSIGTISSASGMAMMIDGAKVYHAFAGLVPEVHIVKREANAGFSMQLISHLGRLAQSGAVKILHTPT